MLGQRLATTSVTACGSVMGVIATPRSSATVAHSVTRVGSDPSKTRETFCPSHVSLDRNKRISPSIERDHVMPSPLSVYSVRPQTDGTRKNASLREVSRQALERIHHPHWVERQFHEIRAAANIRLNGPPL